MSSSLRSIHITCTQNQRYTIQFEDEEHDQLPTVIRLSCSRVDVLARCMAGFNKAVSWTAKEQIFYFVLPETVLCRQLIDYVWQPYEIIN